MLLVVVIYNGHVECWTVVADIYDAMGAQRPRDFQLTEEHWSLKVFLHSVYDLARSSRNEVSLTIVFRGKIGSVLLEQKSAIILVADEAPIPIAGFAVCLVYRCICRIDKGPCKDVASWKESYSGNVRHTKRFMERICSEV